MTEFAITFPRYGTLEFFVFIILVGACVFIGSLIIDIRKQRHRDRTIERGAEITSGEIDVFFPESGSILNASRFAELTIADVIPDPTPLFVSDGVYFYKVIIGFDYGWQANENLNMFVAYSDKYISQTDILCIRTSILKRGKDVEHAGDYAILGAMPNDYFAGLRQQIWFYEARREWSLLMVGDLCNEDGFRNIVAWMKTI